MSHLANAATLLIEIGFGLIALLFLLRLLLQWVGAPFHNPVCQAIYRYSNPILLPLRKLLRPWRRIDLAAGAMVLVTMLVKATALLLVWQRPLGGPAIVLLGLAELIGLLLTVYFWLVLIHVILSWVGNRPNHPAIDLVNRLVQPVLRPWRRLLPALGGFDLSPMLFILLLMLARILLVAPLQELAMGLPI